MHAMHWRSLLQRCWTQRAMDMPRSRARARGAGVARVRVFEPRLPGPVHVPAQVADFPGKAASSKNGGPARGVRNSGRGYSGAHPARSSAARTADAVSRELVVQGALGETQLLGGAGLHVVGILEGLQ